jgi:hypothetical protein
MAITEQATTTFNLCMFLPRSVPAPQSYELPILLELDP